MVEQEAIEVRGLLRSNFFSADSITGNSFKLARIKGTGEKNEGDQ